MDEEYEWDQAKAKQNLTRHGISFETAKLVFDDPFAVAYYDDRFDYAEERFTVIGMVDRRLLVVVCTFRGNITRMISARGAKSHERRTYHEENASF